MKNILIFLWFTLFIGCGSSCGPTELQTAAVDTQEAQEDNRDWLTWDECSHKVGEHPCNFSLKNQHGETVELYDYYGKVIVIDLSAMWCGVCQNIASDGETLSQKYGDEDFVWLTILVEDESGTAPDQSDLERWATMFGITGQVLAGDRSLVDPNAETGYPVTGWPTIAVVDKEMKIYNGVNGWSESLVVSWIDFLIE
jgi:thiol-disulfide isomerase/thioredoxin